ncbi:MAG: hypothetical protein HY895_01355 [Deltaproteobacteria bacterium]|nr:hypothetical protein [Deltaproteobacteria bacterium]
MPIADDAAQFVNKLFRYHREAESLLGVSGIFAVMIVAGSHSQAVVGKELSPLYILTLPEVGDRQQPMLDADTWILFHPALSIKGQESRILF